MKFTKETARRMLRTFLQAFLPALAVGIGTAIGDDGSITKGAAVALIVPAVAAGLAAIMNLEKEESEVEDDE